MGSVRVIRYRLVHRIPLTCYAGLCFAGKRQYLSITLADMLMKDRRAFNTSASVPQRRHLSDVLGHL